MKLPHSDRLEISQSKVVKYLLSSTHRAGRGKARFFSTFGFEVSAWKTLAQALQQHAKDNDVTVTEETVFGTRYVIEGNLTAPNGQELQIRSVWFMDEGRQSPRFVTAYPIKRRMYMIQELEDVILDSDIPEHRLQKGDIGTVVLVHQEGKGYEVEFTTLDGETVAVVTLLAAQVRPVHRHEIAHARELAGSTS
ncbi:DUF4926 domain-containing protein [Nitrospira sp. M1]